MSDSEKKKEKAVKKLKVKKGPRLRSHMKKEKKPGKERKRSPVKGVKGGKSKSKPKLNVVVKKITKVKKVDKKPAEKKNLSMEIRTRIEIRRRAKKERQEKAKREKLNKPRKPHVAKKAGRLYVKATFIGYKRGLRKQHENTALLRVDNVYDRISTRFYIGKKCVFVFKGKAKIRRDSRKSQWSNVRFIWGKVTRPHGNSGVVRAHFKTNLPSKAMGHRIRVVLQLRLTLKHF